MLVRASVCELRRFAGVLFAFQHLDFRFLIVAFIAFAVEGDVDAVGGVSLWEGSLEEVDDLLAEFDIFDIAAFFAVKVGVGG